MGRIIAKEAKNITPKEWDLISKGMETSTHKRIVKYLKKRNNKPTPANVLFVSTTNYDGARTNVQGILRKNNVPFTLATIGNNEGKKRYEYPLAFVRTDRG